MFKSKMTLTKRTNANSTSFESRTPPPKATNQKSISPECAGPKQYLDSSDETLLDPVKVGFPNRKIRDSPHKNLKVYAKKKI